MKFQLSLSSSARQIGPALLARNVNLTEYADDRGSPSVLSINREFVTDRGRPGRPRKPAWAASFVP